MAQAIPRTDLTITGVVILNKQIMVTYDAGSWNRTLGVMNTLRSGAPFFSKGGYSLEKSPLEGGQILQSTALMVTGETDMRPIYDALEKWLPGGSMEPVDFTVDEVMLVVHEFSPGDVFRRSGDLARVQLDAGNIEAPGLAAGQTL